MLRIMPDDLYEHDALAWSIQQATLLRRLAAGERVNDIDWDHVVEEIEDVGISELNATRSYLEQLLLHLLKLRGWPGHTASGHWRNEIVVFQAGVTGRFSPSMRQRIDLGMVYARAKRQAEQLRYDDRPPLTPPPTCPLTLDQLLTASCLELEAAFLASGQ